MEVRIGELSRLESGDYRKVVGVRVPQLPPMDAPKGAVRRLESDENDSCRGSSPLASAKWLLDQSVEGSGRKPLMSQFESDRSLHADCLPVRVGTATNEYHRVRQSNTY